MPRRAGLRKFCIKGGREACARKVPRKGLARAPGAGQHAHGIFLGQQGFQLFRQRAHFARPWRQCMRGHVHRGGKAHVRQNFRTARRCVSRPPATARRHPRKIYPARRTARPLPAGLSSLRQSGTPGRAPPRGWRWVLKRTQAGAPNIPAPARAFHSAGPGIYPARRAWCPRPARQGLPQRHAPLPRAAAPLPCLWRRAGARPSRPCRQTAPRAQARDRFFSPRLHGAG